MINYLLELNPLAEEQSLALYKKISIYKANVTNTGTHLYVMGKASFPQFTQILAECLALSPVKGEILQISR